MNRSNKAFGNDDFRNSNSNQQEPKQNESRMALVIGIIAAVLLIIFGFQ